MAITKSLDERMKDVLKVIENAKPLPADAVIVPYDPERSVHSRRMRARPEDEVEEDTPVAPETDRTARRKAGTPASSK